MCSVSLQEDVGGGGVAVARKDLSVSGNPTGWKICVKELLNSCRLLFPLPE